MSKNKVCAATLAFVLLLAAWTLLGWPLVLMLWGCLVAVPLLLGIAVESSLC